MDVFKEVIEQGVWFLTPQSSNITRIRYLKESQTLIIQFSSGQHYRYKGFPHTLAFELVNAPSKGKFFATRIRAGYKGEKCDENGVLPPLTP